MHSIRLTFTSRRRWEERNSVSLENTDKLSILGELDWALNKGVGVEKRAAFLCYYVDGQYTRIDPAVGGGAGESALRA